MREQPSKRESEGPGLSPVVMSHLLRGELARSDRWRTRLDTTTNWALTTTAAVISFSFANATTSHIPLLVGIWMVTTFLLIEARRYRYYDLWNRRVRLMEDGYFSPMLRHEPVDPDAMRELAQEMSRPQIQLSLFSAISTRLTRAYGPILLVLLLTWFVKVSTHPHPAVSLRDMVDRARVGPISGGLIIGVLVTVSVLFGLLFASAMFARAPLGELRPRRRSRRIGISEVFRPYELRAPRRRQQTPPPFHG